MIFLKHLNSTDLPSIPTGCSGSIKAAPGACRISTRTAALPTRPSGSARRVRTPGSASRWPPAGTVRRGTPRTRTSAATTPSSPHCTQPAPRRPPHTPTRRGSRHMRAAPQPPGTCPLCTASTPLCPPPLRCPLRTRPARPCLWRMRGCGGGPWPLRAPAQRCNAHKQCRVPAPPSAYNAIVMWQRNGVVELAQHGHPKTHRSKQHSQRYCPKTRRRKNVALQ